MLPPFCGHGRWFGRLKNEWGLKLLRVRGLDRVRLHADLTILTRLASTLAAERTAGRAAWVSVERPVRLVEVDREVVEVTGAADLSEDALQRPNRGGQRDVVGLASN